MKSRIKIMYVFGQLGMGGYDTLIMNIARNIDRSKYELIFLNYSDIPSEASYIKEIQNLGIKIIRIDDNRFKNPVRFANDIYKTIKNERIAIIHSHVDAVSGVVVFAAKLAGVNVRVAHAHNAGLPGESKFPRNLIYAVLKKMVRMFATIKLACGEEAGRFLFGKSSGFSIINNGIDLSRFAYSQSDRMQIRKRLGLKENHKVVLHVGRFDKQKNHSYLIDIFAEGYQNDRNLRLILIGKGQLKQEIISKIRHLNLENKVRLLSDIFDAEKYYSASDILVFPSLYEGLPVVLIEAQANGIPCLVSDTVDKNVKMGDNLGFLPIDQSPEIWVKRIEQIRKKRSKARISKELAEYDIKRVVNRLQKTYESAEKEDE